MKLYIKQQVFTIVDRFSIKDENENDVYFVEGDFRIFNKTFSIFDNLYTQVARIDFIKLNFLPVFEVKMEGFGKFSIKKQFDLFRHVYYVDKFDWTVKGTIFGYNYKIINGDRIVATISKAIISWGDYYEINILDENHQLPAIATVLAIDAVIQMNS